MTRCKITVLQRDFHQEFVDLYPEEIRKKLPGPCDVFHEGQAFIVSPFKELPPGFCPWAWDDIFKSIVSLAEDRTPGACCIACCTDGARPVTFKIEKFKSA
jgi:uncharacterized repeat protein (TIGR04076 family)